MGLSPRNASVVQALGTELWMIDPMPSTTSPLSTDVSTTLMHRTRSTKYSMDVSSNIQLLQDEEKEMSPPHGNDGSSSSSTPREMLLRMWTWIDRVESLWKDDIDGNSWMPTVRPSLTEAGAFSIWRKTMGEESVQISDVLGCSVYISPGRRAILTACGWVGKYDLSTIMSDCESVGDYERSAALAVWHGDVAAAVQALQRGATHWRQDEISPTSSSSYAEILELVSLCVAGFRGGSDASLEVWRQACVNLMDRVDLLDSDNRSYNDSTTKNSVAYLRGLLKFLMNTQESQQQQQILDDGSLSLCDRIGFACRFLAKESLQNFLRSCLEQCQKEGNLEGLFITGIDRRGIKLLQAYVDRYADVQTAALVTSRVILPPEWEEEKRICLEWLDSYRSLLNTWQMFQSRAMFDVDRAEFLRKQQAREMGQTKGSNARLQQAAAAANRRLLMGVPYQMDARCTYCQQPLSLKPNNTNTSQWLREMNKSVLSCCPHCRNPLPRCAICMLSMGALNPFLEMQARAGRVSGRQSPEDVTTTSSSNIAIAEWFSWCMRCKHGGHAHHMVGWFSKHNVCPVSGCNCECQFDGMTKLNQPASPTADCGVSLQLA
jgi:hypothetical protein